MPDEVDREAPAFGRNVPFADMVRNRIVEAALERDFIANRHREVGPDEAARAAREAAPDSPFAAVAELMAVVKGVQIDRLVADRRLGRGGGAEEFFIAHAGGEPKADFVAIENVAQIAAELAGGEVIN